MPLKLLLVNTFFFTSASYLGVFDYTMMYVIDVNFVFICNIYFKYISLFIEIMLKNIHFFSNTSSSFSW